MDRIISGQRQVQEGIPGEVTDNTSAEAVQQQ
jgi:hypothetical protein